MVDVPLEFLLALVGLSGSAMGVLVWALKRTMNGFHELEKGLENISAVLNAIVNHFAIWEERWKEYGGLQR